MKKLAIITTHPIQYYAPVFKLLQMSGDVNLRVFYTLGPDTATKYDHGFAKNISWDIPLLDGYDYEWVKNTAKKPGSHHFNGIKNPDLIKQVSEWKPDGVLFYGWAYQSHLKAMRHFKNRLPVYFRGDSTLLDETGGLKQWLRSVMLKWVYRHADYALYAGTRNKAYFKKYGFSDKQLKFTPHAVDNERFGVHRTAEAKALRLNLGIADSDILILFAGKFEEKKAPLLLLNAFLNAGKPGTHLLFAGNGKLESVLKEKAAGQKNVHFLPFQNQSQMPALYQSSDLFCLPSAGPGETWGLAVNEAMACGKAILISDKVGCAVDLVKPGENGVIFKSGNTGDLTSHLSLLIENGNEKLAAMGQRSKEMIKCWSFENQVSAITSLINE